MYDLAIIGAGPAGATLARLIGDSFRVLLVDKRRLADDARRDDGAPLSEKCCGGLLAPDAQRMISRFGLGLPKRVLVEPQLFVVRAIDIPRRVERFYQRYYINMDRSALDRWLVSLVPAGVDRRWGCRLADCRRAAGGFEITLAGGGRTVAERARIVVGADGAASAVRRLLAPPTGAQPAPPAYVAVQEWVEAAPGQPYFSALFDPTMTDYYGWTIPKGDRLLIGLAVPPRQPAAARFAQFKEALGTLGYGLGAVVRREGALIRRPRGAGELSTGGSGFTLIGEAGGWISPSSAEGLSYAFRGALALAEALAPGLEGFEHRYARRMRRLAWNLRLKCLKARLIFQPTLRRAAMLSGLQCMEVLEEPTPPGASRSPRR